MKDCKYRIAVFLSFWTCAILSVYAQNSVKDSLTHTLSQTQDVNDRLEILVNISDLASGPQDITYSRMLWKEAIEADNNNAASVGIAKLMANKLVNKESDSLFYYINQAREYLKHPLNLSISTYFEMIYESRQLQGNDSDECNRIIEKATSMLKSNNNIDKFEKMKNIYAIICSINRIATLAGGNSEHYDAQMLQYAKEMLEIANTVPLEMGGYSYRQQALDVCSASYAQDTPEYVNYILQQLEVYESYLKLPTMQKRPYYSQRLRIQAYGTLSSALTLSQADRDRYFNRFEELLHQYPSQAPILPAVSYLASIKHDYYLAKKDTIHAIEQIDSILKYKTYPLLDISYMKRKANLLSKLNRYEEAYQAHKTATQLSDSLSLAESNDKYHELQTLYEVNATKLKNAELQQHNQKTTIVAGIIILLLAFGWGYYNYSVRRKMQKLNEKIQESETVKTAFLHSMCHEVRTPLNIISGFTTMVLMSEVDDKEKEVMAEEIERQTNLLTKMLNDMLEVSKLDSSDDLLPTEPTDIYAVCDYSITKLYQMHKDQKWVLDAINTGQILQINRTYFSQLVDNLLSNAAKFSNPGAQTTLHYNIDNEKQLLKVSITDTGVGIPKDKQKWVFERFTKIDEFKQGAGLGLYVCRLIVKRMGGTIYIDSSYSQGTRIIFEIPAAYPQ